MFADPLFVERLLCVLIETLSFICQVSVEHPQGYGCLSTIRGAPTVCRMLRLCAFVCHVSVGDLLCAGCFRCCNEQDRQGLRQPVVHRGADIEQWFDLLELYGTPDTRRVIRLLEDRTRDAGRSVWVRG